jgi:hypothetical protein
MYNSFLPANFCVTCLIAVDFMKPAKLAVPEMLSNLRRWHAEVSARPIGAA